MDTTCFDMFPLFYTKIKYLKKIEEKILEMCYEGAEGLKHGLLRTELDRTEYRVKREQRGAEVELGQTMDTDRSFLWLFKFYPYGNLPLESNLHAELDILYSKAATGISYEPHY